MSDAVSGPTPTDAARLRAGRLSVAIAVLLLLIGIFRSITDTLHEMSPDYWRALDGTFLRYLVRAPSDGTLWGDLNARWFKVLSLPAAAGFIFLGYRFGSGMLEDQRREFRDPLLRATWIGVFLAGFTVIEIEKAFHVFGMSAHMLAGEIPWLNHVVHLISAAIAWWLWGWFAFEPLRQAEIDLDAELDALVADEASRERAPDR